MTPLGVLYRGIHEWFHMRAGGAPKSVKRRGDDVTDSRDFEFPLRFRVSEVPVVPSFRKSYRFRCRRTTKETQTSRSGFFDEDHGLDVYTVTEGRVVSVPVSQTGYYVIFGRVETRPDRGSKVFCQRRRSYKSPRETSDVCHTVNVLGLFVTNCTSPDPICLRTSYLRCEF